MPLVSPSRRSNRQPGSTGVRLSGWPFMPDSAYIMLSDRIGRGQVDYGAQTNRPNDMIAVGALPTTLPTTQGWALQFGGASNYYESVALPWVLTYPLAIGAFFKYVSGAAGSAIALADRDTATNGNYYALGVGALGIEADIRPTPTAQLTLTTQGTIGPLVDGAYYACALVSPSPISHHLWFNGIEIVAAIDQGVNMKLTRVQLGGLARNLTPAILNSSNYPILMAWYGMSDQRTGTQGNALSDLAGAWTRNPWRMFEGSGTLAH